MKTEQDMAVKAIRLRAASMHASDLYARVSDELGVLAVLHCPNVAAYYHVEGHRNRQCVFQGFCADGNLARLFMPRSRGRIDVYAMRICDGLGYLYAVGVVY